MKPHVMNSGYLVVGVVVRGVKRGVILSRALLFSFIGAPESLKQDARFLDGDRLNCRLNNVAWMTPAEALKYQEHARALRGLFDGEGRGFVLQDAICALRKKRGLSIPDLARHTGLTREVAELLSRN